MEYVQFVQHLRETFCLVKVLTPRMLRSRNRLLQIDMTKSCHRFEASGSDRDLHISAPVRLLLAVLLAISTLTITGCGGCRQNPTAAGEEEEEEQEKPKEDFENRTPVVIPAVFPIVDTGEEVEGETENQRRQRIERANLEGRKVNRVKAGHWATAYFQVIANNFDGQTRVTRRRCFF